MQLNFYNSSDKSSKFFWSFVYFHGTIEGVTGLIVDVNDLDNLVYALHRYERKAFTL